MGLLQVSYSDLLGQGEIHVDLVGKNGAWLGGGMKPVTAGAGVVEVEYEVGTAHSLSPPQY